MTAAAPAVGRPRWFNVMLAAATCLASGAAAQAAPCADPPSSPGVQAICGVTAPEDLVVFRDRFVIVSSMAPAATLFLLDSSDDSLGPMPTRLEEPPDGLHWGDPACPVPARMVSHGLDLLRTPDGRWRLLAVSHGERESVEFFEVLDAGGAAPALAWRGCVLAAEGAAFNDVAALPDGGFLATDPSGDSWQRVRALLGVLGFNTGRVFRWHPQTGYSVVPNTATPYPNGIVLGPDGDSFYLNVYFDNEVRQQDLRSGEILGRAAVRQPDNSNWSPEGELLVASHRAPVRTLFRAVGAAPGERNRIPFAIVAVDPADMRTRELYLGDGAALGGGTAAVRVGGAIYVGAFRGDRLLKLLSPPR